LGRGVWFLIDRDSTIFFQGDTFLAKEGHSESRVASSLQKRRWGKKVPNSQRSFPGEQKKTCGRGLGLRGSGKKRGGHRKRTTTHFIEVWLV